jgi:NAD(P)-dependent dehydrogenase (short-subunit alcohol dehydrogenase family)
MKEKIVLITGASGGLGKAIIPILIEKGYTLALQADSRATELKAFLVDHGLTNCAVFESSLDDELACMKLVDRVEAELGKISFLVNNAGINRTASSHKLAASDWNAVLNLNLTIPFLLSKSVSKQMIEDGFGRIVHISSVVGAIPVAGTAAYAASKAGLMGMARAQSADWAKYGITVNCIAPGYLDKGMIEQVPEKMIEQLKETIPARTLGDAKGLAAMIAYLFSDEAAYVNGQTIGMNGGLA